MKFKIIIASLFLFIITACGYKVVDQNYSKKINIVETNITGDKRIAYLIRNKFVKSDKINNKSVKLDLVIKKIKQIEEKNISNEITKYKVIISVKVNFYIIEDNKSDEFSISKNGIYNVNERYSETLNNEKTLIKNIVNSISDKIIKTLITKIDEL
tara:strand:+ start:27 stop:494 length:468 start_codon:yes stop_codon:yes gene_type:complete